MDVFVGHQADVHAFEGAGQVADVVGVYGQITPRSHQAAVDDVAFEFEVYVFGMFRPSAAAGLSAFMVKFHYIFNSSLGNKYAGYRLFYS